MSARRLCGIKVVLYLFASALVFALPFMTKSLGTPSAFFAVFGWCGLIPLFVTVFGFEKTLKRVLCSLFCFFFAFYFFVYSWFVNLYPLDFAGLGALESVGVIVVAETVIPLLHGAVMTLCVFAAYLAARGVKSTFLRAVLVSFGYVLGEYLQSVGTFAFPWARLFVGQTAFPSLLQSASLLGSYFITFLMVLVNALVAFCFMSAGENNRHSRIFALVAAAVFAVNALFGFVRINAADLAECEKLDAVVLQGNIPSSEKWSGEVDEKEVYSELALMLKESYTDIAVMPETAFPVTLHPDDGYTSSHERALIEIANVLDAELLSGAFAKEDGKSYNSIFVISADGNISKPYNKYNIVPFGEFLPYRSIIEKLAPSFAEMNMFSSDISRGESFRPLETQHGMAACLVCFDSIFPETARRQIKNGGQFIVIATNDSWYKTSSAIYQHADHAVMRAIENNVPVIRSANTGISRIIDAKGRIVEQTSVNERTAISGGVYLPGKTTLYTQIGDVFVLVCALGIAAGIIISSINRKSASRQ